MERAKEDLKIENPESKANVLSRLFFIWTIPFFKKLLNDSWIFSDVPVLPPDDAHYLGQKLEYSWEQEIERANNSKRLPLLWNAMLKNFGCKKRFYDFILLLNYVVMRPGLCILLALLIRTFREEYDLCDRCIFGGAFVTVSVLIFIIEHSVHFQLNKIGLRMRAALSLLIYKKILNLSSENIEKVSPENVVKLITEDLYHFQSVASFGSKAFICVIQFIVIIVAMWDIVGFPSLSGLLFIIVVVFPISSIYFRIQKTLKIKIRSSTNTRVTFVKEIIDGIKTIKVNKWEIPFEKVIKQTRKLELNNISSYFNYHLTFYNFFIHKFCTYLSILCLFFYNKSLLPEEVFPCSQFLFIALVGTIYWIPRSLTAHSDAYLTLDYITNLLLMKEIKMEIVPVQHEKQEIKLKRLCVNWSENNEFDLRIEDIGIKPGSLYIVVGPNNSGKSTLLKLLIKELYPRCGKITMKGSLSYCSQQPWLDGSTIRNNILFGRPYNDGRYKNVINTCNLLPDLSQFMNGDASGVGTGGVTLGEDQKSRINLARAIYQDADIYLIDDVLSLMDVEVSSKLFDDCFTRYLARKTRVVVTNQKQFLDKADHIIVVNEGRAQIFDNLTQVKDSNIDLYAWIEDTRGRNKIKRQCVEYKNKFKFNGNDGFYKYLHSNIIQKGRNGIVQYAKTGDFFLFTCFWLILTYAVIACCDYWLAYWTNQSYLKPDESTKLAALFTDPFLQNTTKIKRKQTSIKDARTDIIVYTVLILSSIVLIATVNRFFINFFITAAKKMHEKMSFSVLRAPMKFFQSNNIEKTFQIFTLDVKTIDRKLPEAAKQTIEIYLFSIGCIILVYISDYILLFSILIIIAYVFLQKFYLKISKIVNHLENTARFPILSHLKYTLQGITTIRVCDGQRKSTIQFEKLLDNHSSLYRLNLACIFSFAMWSDILSNIFLLFTIFVLILTHECGNTIEPSYAGLAILQVYQLTEILQYGSKRLIQTSKDTESIKKIIEYSKLLGEQSDKKKYNNSLEFSTKNKMALISLEDYTKAPETWPEKGVIEFRNVFMTYYDKIQALEDLNFTIKSSEKIGIVGRPGSGKSSIVSAIFNLYDFDGTIVIDNIDTKLVLLECLRKHISVIQEPVLFSESIAYNLDPLGEFSEKQLWDVLEEVNLKKHIDSLSEFINPSTKKFTKGQIVLLCLAREILRKNKIIIFDEVTVHLDDKTEELFNQLVKTHFCNCTILYITSHLSPAIMECDRVLVMEKGQVVDYDHPFSLLESEGSFYKLVSEAGKSVYSRYRHLAYQQYVTKFKCNENAI